MTAFYNEIDPYAAAWLRNLIAAGHIAPGVVDERSIEDINPEDLLGYTQCHFFSGIGVWSYALRRAGWPDDRPVWTGSCPCQPFSAAGKGAGADDLRHLWPAWHHLIAAVRPPVVFGEQVEAAIRHGWLDLVQADLEGIGYAFGAAGLPAAGVGAPHIRQRLWFVAQSNEGEWGSGRGGSDYPSGAQLESAGRGASGPLVNPAREQVGVSGCTREPGGPWADCDWIPCRDGKFRPVEPSTFPLAHGAPSRVGRLRAYGNAIVAPCAEAFIRSAVEAFELKDMLS